MTLTRSILAVPVLAAGIAFGNPLMERAPVCKADNCLRGITQTSTVYKPSLTVRMADCSNFMTTTVTPQATTITITNTATASATTTLGRQDIVKRQSAVTSAPTQPAYATWCINPAAYSSGCSCAGITATTITAATPSITVTATAISTATSTVAPVLCNNAGLEWAYFANPVVNNDPPYYSDYNVNTFKTQAPEGTGITNYAYISGQTGQPETIYGVQNLDPGYTAFAHRGYLYATQTGTYTFTSSAADDVNDFWLGPVAYSGWTRQNTILTNINSNFVGGASTTQQLVAGTYYPFRLLFGNGQGGAYMTVSITAPNGTVILDANTGPSTSIVRFSCDGVIAPPFPAWGNES